ncbi:Down syndrome cell adhesion molecule-like protein Dscam2, partial [Rhipicephalus sanguineus]|uniref:Down syndrome cell adhesion molecule-like protein Dscam2 n=1 Tax=Rhipicephalus sanguineus TaxID=34632 RepID=UPI0020C40DFC
LILVVLAVSTSSPHLSGGRGPAVVVEPPTVVEFSNEMGAVLACSAQGQPHPSIRWEKEDGSPATSVPGLREIRSDGSLALPAFGASQFRPEVHLTTYRCVASNTLGLVKSRLTHVRGVVLEKFEASVYDAYVVRGNSAVLRCHLPPVVKDYVTVTSWVLDDGVTIGTLAESGVHNRYLMLTTGELLVRDVDGSTEAHHSYRCQVHNKLTGESHLSTSAGKIVVTEPHSQLPSRMAEYRSELEVEQGERVVLPCLAQGHPPPRHHWFRVVGGVVRESTILHGSSPGGVEGVIPVKASDRVSLLPGGTLLLRAARILDSGKYLCVANNSAGEDRAYTDLLVTVPLSAHIDPPVQVVDVGRSANMSCRVVGHPVHGVLWTHNGHPVSGSTASYGGRQSGKLASSGSSSRITMLSRDLIHISVVERQDHGMYQCLVYNDRDSAQGSAQLVIGEDAPVFEHVFAERQLRPGGSVSLRCSASGTPLPQITWSLDGTPVPEHYHVRIGDYVSGERLVHSYVNLTGVRVEDGGLYSCVARNGVGRVSHTARLNVLGRPLVRPMANVTALAGRTMRLHCAVAGHPIQSIVWQKDGRSLPQNHRQRSFPNGSLVVADVQRSADDGWYSCVARDPQGNTAKGQLAVHVMTPPVVNPFSFADDLIEGKRAGAACIVSDGDLPITIQWLKDGVPVEHQRELGASVADANDYTSFLSFTGVRQLHSGNYTCVASNPAASANYTAPMVVQVPPTWRQEPVDKAAIMGQVVIFDCQADGFPVPVIRWKKEYRAEGGRDFSVIISNANVQILENGSLSIREADRSDAGHYMCQALNGVGPGISTVVKLDIHVAAHFERKFQALTARRGDSVVLTCRAVGEQPITVTWTKDRHGFNPALEPRYAVEEKPSVEGFEYVIRIPSVDRRDSSLFSCYAENAYGRDDTNFQVVVQEPPDKPRGLEATQTTSRSVTLSWSPAYSGNSPVLKYLLEHKLQEGFWEQDSHVSVIESTEFSHVISGLRPKTSYEFRLRAENSIGLSESSDTLVVTTDEEAPTGAPQNIRVTPTGSRSLQVSWKPPLDEESNGLVQGYYVGYRVRNAKDSFAYKTLESSANSLEQQCELTDLRRNTRYSVVVQAFNAKGAGPASEEVFSQTLEIDPPAAPRLRLVSSTSSSVHLSWDIEKDQPINGFVLFHKAEPPMTSKSESAEESGEWTEVQTGAERSAYAFRGLRCGRKYAFHAVAFNAAGRGPSSNTVLAKTDGSTPLAPDERDLLLCNVTSVTLQLGAWKSGGCPIFSFAVLCKPQSQNEWSPATATHLVPDHQQPPVLVIPDLLPATWYDLLVTAQNDAGATEAEYIFATLTLSGGTVPPPQWTQAVESQRRHIHIILPTVCSLFVVILLAAAVCYVFSRRRVTTAQRPYSANVDEVTETTKSVDTVPMSVWEGADSKQESETTQHRRAVEHEQLYYPSPYATREGRLTSLYATGGLQSGWASARSLNSATDEAMDERMVPQHTYDVPFARRPSSPEGKKLHKQPDGQGHVLGSTQCLPESIYSKPGPLYTSPEKYKGIRKSLQALSIIEGYPNTNVSYVYSRPKKKHWSTHGDELYAEHKLRKLSRYADGLKQAELDLHKGSAEFSSIENHETSEAECDMHARRFSSQR